MVDPVIYAAAAVLLAFGAHRWVLLRGERRLPALRFAADFAFCLGAALLVLAPDTAAAIERTAGLPGLAMLVGDALRMTAACFLGLLAAALREPRSPREPVVPREPLPLPLPRPRGVPSVTVLALAVGLVLAVGFFLAAHVRSVAGEVSVPTADRAALAGYDATSLLYVGWQLATVARQIRSRSRFAGTSVLRIGLRLIGWSAAVGVLWTAWGFDDVRQALATGRQTDGEDLVSVVLGFLCVTLIAAGGTATGWARAAAPLRRRRWACRSHLALAPLWTALYQAFPEIALAPPGRRRARRLPRDVQFALYRRVIEIRDGLLLLRPHLPPLGAELEESAAGSAGPAAEAAVIVRALARASSGERSTGAGEFADSHPAGLAAECEVEWLVRVSAAFADAATGSRGLGNVMS
ncbi:hypothetical protein P3T36_005633 [Kitasatospora sp. MAP12-15]|uniref:MAB_1171c family putative transporter n=1 Tax=unclassified Kitasatospora TaxID=2633591 RepID=UPI0024733621|nr:MAB_1171c family putative transporter [Kitasatospora sp. MAP12-44]MDH6113855.1 hypothetical protein [Kitasatospora sp. MAP12-44]